MNEVLGVPACPIWRLNRPLSAQGIQWHCMEGSADDRGELALVTNDGQAGGLWRDRKVRGVASLRPDESMPVVEWGATHREVIAAYSRALRRLGWKGCDLASAVYGDTS